MAGRLLLLTSHMCSCVLWMVGAAERISAGRLMTYEGIRIGPDGFFFLPIKSRVRLDRTKLLAFGR